MDKLNALAARAMGWEWLRDPEIDGWFWYYPNGNLAKTKSEWHPATCADDALVLLGNIGLPYSAGIQSPAFKGGPAFCYFHGGARKDAETVPLAMTLLALTAAGIPESEITAAME